MSKPEPDPTLSWGTSGPKMSKTISDIAFEAAKCIRPSTDLPTKREIIKVAITEALDLERNRTCGWVLNEDYGYYDTQCKEAFCFDDGSREENKYLFCPNCSGKIIDHSGDANEMGEK